MPGPNAQNAEARLADIFPTIRVTTVEIQCPIQHSTKTPCMNEVYGYKSVGKPATKSNHPLVSVHYTIWKRLLLYGTVQLPKS